MHESTINSRHAFQHILQTLSQIVAVPQTRVLIEHDVYFHVEFVPRMVSLQTLNLFDSLGEAHRQVEKDVTLIGGGCGTGEVADVFTGCS